MVKEQYVSIELAKLIKEHGFNESCWRYYDDIFDTISVPRGVPYKNEDMLKNQYSAPTLQMVMAWVKDTYNILVIVDYNYECTNESYFYKIYRLDKNGKPYQVPVKGTSCDKDGNETEVIVGYRDYETSYNDYADYATAAEEGIKYCLKNKR